MIQIIENSPGLARYFEQFLEAGAVPFATVHVYQGAPFPVPNEADAYILTGDFSNISDGLEPYHEKEIAFVRALRDRRVFGSCFSHQLMAHITGGAVRRRPRRSFGWQPLALSAEGAGHPAFEGLDRPHFVCMNGDEVGHLGPHARLLGEADDCRIQVVAYGREVLTMQSHPEMLARDVEEIMRLHRDGLLDRCEDLDQRATATRALADDRVNQRFMDNVIRWLLRAEGAASGP